MLRRIRIVAWFLVALAAILAPAVYLIGPDRLLGRVSNTASPFLPLEGEFALIAQDGSPFTFGNLADKPSVVFFGFTHCPDICPTGLAELTELMKALGPDADKLQVLFVGVDAARDTQAVLKDYLTAFDPRIKGLSGPKTEIDKVVATFKAYYEIVPDKDSANYTVNHTAGMYLIDRNKRFVGKLDSHEPEEARLAKLKRLIGDT